MGPFYSFTPASSPSEDSTPAVLRSNYPIDWLPTQSIVKPTDGRDGFWVVKTGGIMTPTSPNLKPRDMLFSYELPDGTEAFVPTSSESRVRFVKTNCCWRRIRLVDEGVELVIDRNRGIIEEPAYGDFLEVRQLPERPKHVGDDQGQAGPSTLGLHIPVSSAKDGIFKDYDLPAFRADLDPDLKVSISLHITLVRDIVEASMAHSIQVDAYVDGKPITRGQLTKHAATVVTELMDGCKAMGSPLCFNKIEVDPYDLLLVDLEQVAQRQLRLTIAARHFESNLA